MLNPTTELSKLWRVMRRDLPVNSLQSILGDIPLDSLTVMKQAALDQCFGEHISERLMYVTVNSADGAESNRTSSVSLMTRRTRT